MRGRINDKVTRELLQEVGVTARRLNQWVEDAIRRLEPTRHGWVVPNADGSKAKCGGPGGCEYCKDELDRHDLDVIARMLEQNGLKRREGVEGLLRHLGVEVP